MQRFLDRFEYGNKDIAAGIDKFWLSSSLEISANEQITFLSKLYLDELPVDPRAMAVVRRILVLESTPKSVLSGKTGSGIFEDGTRIGWFVGHIEIGGTAYVFATNLHRGKGDLTGARARAISKSILRELGLR